ncbi:mucin-binding protein [Secundilactobacillus similis]|uniref:Gram-positive cocci surface proteins LPxTG domain-containing protein n=1 Tax=Secundilactobacillus similis DSM 23365 = JCM 2765 TaxID=1423804 RepID=A0A0R2EP86_9LACO|nr:MucBP domain-containing protein [Secundilactobacillus similis]KRN18217.1 hypothetical protein FD14_GL002081 [Secundilactobacillus similis DSM 23365 = JCM 2765]
MRIKQLAREGKLSYRYKMFKAGKFMMTSALASVALWGGLALTNQTASAATTQVDNAVTATVADTSATASNVSDDNTSQVTTGDATTTNDTSASVTNTTTQTTDDSAVVNDDHATTLDNTTSGTTALADTNTQTAETTTKTDDTQVASTSDTTAVQSSIAKDDSVATDAVQSDDSTAAASSEASKSEDAQVVDATSATSATADATHEVATDSVATPTDIDQTATTITLPKNVTLDETTATAKVGGEISDADLASLKTALATKAAALGVTPKIEMLADDVVNPELSGVININVYSTLHSMDPDISVLVGRLSINGVPDSSVSLKYVTQLAGFSSNGYTLSKLVAPTNGNFTEVTDATWDTPLTYVENNIWAYNVYLVPIVTDDGEVTVTRTINYQVADGSELLGETPLPDSITESMTYHAYTNHGTGTSWYEPVAGADTYLEHDTPEIEGYTADKTSVAGKIAMVVDNATTPTDEVITVTYTGNTVTSNVNVPTTVIGAEQPTKSTSFTDVTGNIGETLTLTMPALEGYTPDKTTVSATVNLDGTITTNDTVTYNPNEATSDVTIPATVAGEDAPQTVTNVTGKTGDSLTLDAPTVEGYTPDKATVTATVNPDGTITTKDNLVYSPNEVTTDVTVPATVAGESAPQTIKDATGKTGDTLTLDVPAVEGYTPDKSTVTATVNPDGTITTTDKVIYTPNEVTTDVTIPATVGDQSEPQTVTGVTGKTGDTLTITVPTIKGYTPDKTTVTATVNPDGTITTKDNLIYTANSVIADVTVPATVDGQSQPQTIKDASGKTGDTLTLDVPELPGYTADKDTITATVNPDGTITTEDNVVYTAIPTTPTDNGSTGTTPSDNGDVDSTTPPTTGTDSETTNPVVSGSTSETVVPNTDDPETQTGSTSKTFAETQTVTSQTTTGRQTVTNTVAAAQVPATISAEAPVSSTTTTAPNEVAKLPQTDEVAKTPASLLGLVLLALAGLGFGKFKRHE